MLCPKCSRCSPHFAVDSGMILRRGSGWYVRFIFRCYDSHVLIELLRKQLALDNSPIPLYIDHDAEPHEAASLGLSKSDTKLSDREESNTDWVVIGQNLGSLVQPLNIIKFINSDEPMIAVKLSYYPNTNQTAIGFNFSHIIGLSGQSYVPVVHTTDMVNVFPSGWISRYEI